MRKLLSLTAAGALAFAACGTAIAHGHTEAKATGPEMGQHTMPATVTQVNHTSGVVNVRSEGMNMMVHFPPKAVAKLKSDDHIVLHLAYQMAK